MNLSVGSRIELNDGRQATIRFLGTTSFQTGEWVGIELEEATGKNDGSVKGERYFDCEMGYGMFLRQAGVKKVVETAATPKKAKPAASNGVLAKGTRASGVGATVSTPSGLKRQSIAPGAAERRSASGVSATATPHARTVSGVRASATGPSSTAASRTGTPAAAKRPTAGAAPTSATRSRTSMPPPPTTTASKRTSMLPPASRTTRPTTTPSTVGAKTATRDVSGRVPPGRTTTTAKPDPRRRAATPSDAGKSEADADYQDEQSELQSEAASTTASQADPQEEDNAKEQEEEEEEEEEADEEEPAKVNFAPPSATAAAPEPSHETNRTRRSFSPTNASVKSQHTIRSTTASNREKEELEAKIRLLERKRMEDREIKKSLEQTQQERDQYKSIIEKLQNKYRPQQQEIADLKKALSEAEKKGGDTSALQAEHDSVMELATIDREMAEEKAQNLEEELEALRVRNEEVELELEILREENEELGKEMSPEERTSAGWMQMEKSNDRLRDALVRLRDITEDKEAELKDKIEDLEDQVQESEAFRLEFETIRDQLTRSNGAIQNLRQQLEASEESENMIEELAEQKSQLEDRIHQLRNTIEELEELRELNDEIVVNHQEDEKQMQEEIDFKDSLLLERERAARQQQEALDEADSTVLKYRTLVSELHSSLQEVQASKQLSDNETADLNSKSRAMLDLNMKLQSSASKTQVKTIDLELRKLEAQEASEHLSIVQLLLPDAFQSERDSVLALLRFKRVSFKATLVHGFLKERVASFGTRGQDEDIFPACGALDSLTWIATMADRFINSICGCSVDDFGKYESTLYELEPIERALNSYIDGLRRDELHEKDMAEELQRSIAVMTHLASLHIPDDLPSQADHLLMRTQCLQSQLESTASALGLTRSMIENNLHAQEGEDEDHDEAASEVTVLLNRTEALVSQARSAKVTAGKTHRSLADLEVRSLTLEASCTESFEGVESVATRIATYSRLSGIALQALFGEEGRTESFDPSEVASILSHTATSVFDLPSAESGPFSTLTSRLKELSDLLADLSALPTDLDNTIEFERAPKPWVARATELKQTKLTSLDTEAQLARALEATQTHETQLKDKDTELEEQTVRIEMLEARMRDASKRSAKIAELERHLHTAKDGEKKARQDLARAKDDAKRDAERIRAEMSRLADERSQGDVKRDLDEGAMGSGAKLSMKRQASKITSLEGAVRYLHDENHRLRMPAAAAPLASKAALDWLHEPLVPKAKTERQAVRKEGKDALQRLLLLATRPQTVDLTTMPANKLAWRPAKETSRWKVERRKEEWEVWRDETRDVLARGQRVGVK